MFSSNQVARTAHTAARTMLSPSILPHRPLRDTIGALSALIALRIELGQHSTAQRKSPGHAWGSAVLSAYTAKS
jgi:hypothetical protein